MKWSQRIFGLIAAAIVGFIVGVIILFSPKGDANITTEDLAGTWNCVISDTSIGSTLLTNAGFTDEELALISDKSFCYMVIAEFDNEKSYSLAFDYDVTAQYVADLFSNAFDDLYAGRADLSESYGQDLSPLSEEEFRQLYAQRRGAADFDSLFAEMSAYEFSGISVYDSGSYKIKDAERITFNSGNANYIYSDGHLTLEFSDVTMELTRVE